MFVGKDWKIESDSLNIILYKKFVSKKNGVLTWRPIAYFATLQSALKHLVNLEVNETELKDLVSVNKKLGELLALVKKLQLSPEVLQHVRRSSKKAVNTI